MTSVKQYKVVLLLTWLCFSWEAQPGFTQTNASLKDSLQQLINTSQSSSTSHIDGLIQYAKLYLEHQPDTALAYVQTALTLSQNLNYEDGLARCNHYLGDILANQGAFSQAIRHYYEATDLYIAIGNFQGEAEVYNALGNLYYFTRQLEESLQQHEKALAIYEKNGLKKGEAITLGFIGHFYEKQGAYEKALFYQNQSLVIYENLQDFAGLSTINGNLGSIYEDLQEYAKARNYFLLALQYNLQTNNEQERIVHLNNLGDTYRKEGLLDQGIEFTIQSLDLATRLEQKYQMESALKDLSKTYELKGDHEKAFVYLQQAYDLYDDLYNEESALQVSRLQTLHEITEKQKEIELLEREKRIALITRNAFLSGLLMLLLLAGIVLSRQRLKIRKNRELYKAQQELTQIELQNAKLSKQKLQSELEAKANQLTNHALHIIQKNKMLKELKTKLNHLRQHHKTLEKPVSQLIDKIDHNFTFDKDWKDFNEIFEQVHPEFYHHLNEKFPDLTAAEIRLCALLKLNLDSKDIATILGISQDSLRVNRYRLRKKLSMEKGANLTTFIMAI